MALEDVLEVQQLLFRYAAAVDERDGETVANCFTSDGIFASSFSGETVGREEIIRLFESKAETSQSNRRHFITNPYVEILGSEGTFTAYVFGTKIRQGEVHVSFTGRYFGRLKKIDGQWLFAERRMEGDNKPVDWA